MMESELDLLCVNALRFLSVDAVQKANSGHPGLPLGSASMAYALWDRFLKINPRNPAWVNRDRFVLSAGHGCALLYSLLHVTGFDLTLEDLKNFRQWQSRTPGHPEYGKTPGVEATTGPLGQGFSNAVGMAIAEESLSAKFNRGNHRIVDHFTYVIASDGDLMEGVSSEAASLAGHLRLSKLIVLYDNNRISIEGNTEIAFTEDVEKRFSAYRWHTQHVEDGNNLNEVISAIECAKNTKDRPSLILVRNHIGFGSPHKQDSASAHGEPLGRDEVTLTKEHLGWPVTPAFYIPDDVLKHFRLAVTRGEKYQRDWNDRFQKYASEHSDLAKEFIRVTHGELPQNFSVGKIPKGVLSMSTRDASEIAINALAPAISELIGGSADLSPSTKTIIKDGGDFEPANPYGATFLIFSDYMRPPMRLAAMNGLPVIYVFTHDSIGLGEDGPTHQAVEQLLGLRSIPGMSVIRPGDANETLAAWENAIQRRDGPTALILTRQKVPVFDLSDYPNVSSGVSRGGYCLSDSSSPSRLDLILIATGSEVHLALESQKKLRDEGIFSRVVSMPSLNIFESQNEAYRNDVLPATTLWLVIEAGLSLGWNSYLGPKKIETVCVDRYGASAPGDVVMKEYGFNVDHICDKARRLCTRTENHKGT
jgi:transketolase